MSMSTYLTRMIEFGYQILVLLNFVEIYSVVLEMERTVSQL
jgi:hypothetical protein